MVRVSLAMAELRAGASDAAWSVISPLIDQVGASGEIGGVLLCGNAALVELDRAAWGPAATQDGRKELARWARLSTESSVKQEPQGEPGTTGDTAPGALSVREMEVLGHIAEGASNKVVARRLSLSPHTVKRHVARILDRLELSSRTEAAAWYHRHVSAAARGSPSS
jgi:LuxR family maltose regulon positive regulatory protein